MNGDEILTELHDRITDTCADTGEYPCVSSKRAFVVGGRYYTLVAVPWPSHYDRIQNGGNDENDE